MLDTIEHETWPRGILQPRDVAIDLVPRNTTGLTNAAGRTQVIGQSAGTWSITFGSILVNTRERVLAWRAFAARLGGRAGKVVLPLCGAYQPLEWREAKVVGGETPPGVPFGDDSYFDDGMGFASSVTSSVKQTPLRAVEIEADSNAAVMEAGQHFSIGTSLYRVRAVQVLSDGSAKIAFTPPLRRAVEEGETMELGSPVILARLATDREMDLMLEGGRMARPSVRFTEVL